MISYEMLLEIMEIVQDKYNVEDHSKDYDSAAYCPSAKQMASAVRDELNKRVSKAEETIKRWGNDSSIH